MIQKPRIMTDFDLNKLFRDLRGEISLGFGGGVVESKLFFTGEEVITLQSMPGVYVQQCMDEVARLSDDAKRRKPGGAVRGRIPLPIYYAWRKEWQKGPHLHGVLWRTFLDIKLKDRDYSRFRVKGV